MYVSFVWSMIWTSRLVRMIISEICPCSNAGSWRSGKAKRVTAYRFTINMISWLEIQGKCHQGYQESCRSILCTFHKNKIRCLLGHTRDDPSAVTFPTLVSQMLLWAPQQRIKATANPTQLSSRTGIEGGNCLWIGGTVWPS